MNNKKVSMMLNHGDDLTKGNIIRIVDSYTDPDTGFGYHILLVVPEDGEIAYQDETNGIEYVPSKIDRGFITIWEPK